METYSRSQMIRQMQMNEQMVYDKFIKTGMMTEVEVLDLMDEISLSNEIKVIKFYAGVKDGQAFKNVMPQDFTINPVSISKVYTQGVSEATGRMVKTVHIFIPQLRMMKMLMGGKGVA